MGKNLRIKTAQSHKRPLLDQEDSASHALSDLEHGDALQPENVTFCRILRLAKPDAGKLVLATIALLIASTTSILIPKFGGKIIDIVSREVQEPEQKFEALDAVKNTIVQIVLIVIIGFCTMWF